MAGGGVAEAVNYLYLDAGNNVKIVDEFGEITNTPPGAAATPSGKTLSVTGGAWNDWFIFGSYGGNGLTPAERSGYGLTVDQIERAGTLKVYGGCGATSGGNANGNTLTVKNHSTVGDAYGGFSYGPGSASGNNVTIQDSTAIGTVSGGYASGGGLASGNTLTIQNSALTGRIVYGGYSDSNVALDNHVEITGGTLNDMYIIGGRTASEHSLTGNTVRINGATLGANIYTFEAFICGANGQGSNRYNMVSLLGALENGAPTMKFVLENNRSYDITGVLSHTNPNTNLVQDNAVSLAGAIGWDGGKLRLHGYYDESGTYGVPHTGNELHLGGIRTYTKNENGTGYTASLELAEAFAGYTKTDGQWTRTNAVTTVDTFDKIVLHKVDWSTTVPALKAGSFTYYTYNATDIYNPNSFPDGSKTTLDISDMTFDKAPIGTMTLLQSDAANNFDSLKLAYNAATQTTPVDLTTDRIVKTETNAESTENGVTMTRDATHTVSLADTGKKVNYTVNGTVNSIAFGEMTWGTARDASAAEYNYAGLTAAKIDASGLIFKKTETIAAGSATLLEANNTLADFSAQTKNLSYENYSPVPGVTLNGQILGSYAAKDGKITYTATENKANKLTFGAVEWKDTLMTRPENITFAGADVDTSNISFTGVSELNANQKMTLVSDFGGTVGTITGDKYKIGTTLEGKGKASLSGKDLIFTAEANSEGGGGGGGGGKGDSGLVTQAQTHNTVMGAEVGMAALSMGNDFIGEAMLGLGLDMNTGDDGFSTFAKLGGGAMRQETGSHIDSHMWNAILGLGHQNKKERGTFEYGAFFEYGSGNYTTQSDEGRGDGSSRYTGGGILGKYTLANGVYVEGSFRAGTVHDDARDVLHDAKGVGYSYDTNANYLGAHIGFGKEIQVAGGNVVDVYGKYFYNRRNSVSFDVAAGDHYDLDAVTSQVIRVGARYTMKRDKWNFYGGVAYEHELDGKANGTAGNGGVSAPIRGADTSGASFRGELGATMKPGENSPWSLDLNVAGFAGKKQGFTGGVSVAFMF